MLTAPYPTKVLSPRGTWGDIFIRDDTSDMSIVLGTFNNQFHAGANEYGLRDTHISGVFVDVGAHIGTVALAVLLDNPGATAILVEPLPENVAMIRQTLDANGLTDRATVLQAAVGKASVRYGTTEGDRFVGNIGTHAGKTIRAEVVTLAQLVEMAGGHIAALKTDCEGGEWALLRSKSVGDIDLIFGEWHGNAKHREGRERLTSLLGATHELTEFSDDGGIGLFRAVRR